MPGGISEGWRMLSAFGGATGELVALLAKEGGGGELLGSARAWSSLGWEVAVLDSDIEGGV